MTVQTTYPDRMCTESHPLDTQPHEEELIRRVRASDEEAFFQLFQKYQAPLFKLVFYHLRDRERAEDLVQDVFLKLWIKRGKLQPCQTLWPFLSKISRGLVTDALRRRRIRLKHRVSEAELMTAPSNSPEKSLELGDLEARIAKVIEENLTVESREILLLNRVGGLTHRQVADLVGTTPKTVENRIYRALHLIRKKCADYL